MKNLPLASSIIFFVLLSGCSFSMKQPAWYWNKDNATYQDYQIVKQCRITAFSSPNNTQEQITDNYNSCLMKNGWYKEYITSF